MLLLATPSGVRYTMKGASPNPAATCRRSVIAMAKDALAEADKDGAFKRTDATFRSQVGPGSEFEPEGTFHCIVTSA